MAGGERQRKLGQRLTQKNNHHFVRRLNATTEHVGSVKGRRVIGEKHRDVFMLLTYQNVCFI